MIRLALIAYDFPPLNSGGSHRPLRFVRYLEQFGIQATVFTGADYPSDANFDEHLSAQIPTGVKVVRSKLGAVGRWQNILNSNYFQLTDDVASRWEKSLVESFKAEHAASPFDAIMISAPPFSTVSIAADLANEFQLPLTVDLRDAWSQWCITPYASLLHYWMVRKHEGTLLARAAKVIVPTNEVGEDLIRQHANLRTRIATIPNGFDDDGAGQIGTADRSHQGPITVGYVGSFYYHPYSRHLMFSPWYRKKPYQFLQYAPRMEDWLYRSPYFFLAALAKLFDLNPSLRGRLVLRIAGKQPKWLAEMIEEFGLQESVELVGFVQKRDLSQFYSNCTYALATSVKVIGGRDYCVAGKSYEYMQHGVPVLGFVTPGAQRDMLEGSGLATLFDPDAVEHNALRLDEMLAAPRRYSPNTQFLGRFNASALTRDLAGVIHASCDRQQRMSRAE